MKIKLFCEKTEVLRTMRLIFNFGVIIHFSFSFLVISATVDDPIEFH